MPRLRGAAWGGRPVTALLFDLDGTLLDTVRDIALALNRTLADYRMAPIGEDQVRGMIGRGSPSLIERATAAQGRAADPAAQAAMVERFFHHCGEIEASESGTACAFPGAAEALRRLHAAGLRTAVVTNKHHRFAAALLARLRLSDCIDVVIGGDTCARRKPDPEPLLHACRQLQVSVSETLMVGDSVNDVEAARAAGMPIVCVSYGYNEGRQASTLDCDALLDSLEDLPPLLLEENA